MKVLKSRKFWAALITAIVVVLKDLLQLPDAVIKALVTIAGIYIGGTALEDGLKGWYPELFKKKDSK